LLLNSCDGEKAKQRVFFDRLLVALKRAGGVVRWLWKEPVLVQQMFKVMSSCLHACTQPLSLLINSFDVLWYACPCVNDALRQVAGVAVMCLAYSCISRQIL